MHAAATEMDVKKAIAAKLNTAQKLKPNSSNDIPITLTTAVFDNLVKCF